MLEREDGPIKHYYAVCDGCRKDSKRQAEDFDFSIYEALGWKEVEIDGGYDVKHYCPQCAGTRTEPLVKEVIPNPGDSDDISDHEAVHRPVKRISKNELVIDLGNGCKWTISSNTAIRVEQHDE
jgi:hypothetical protein